MTHAPCCAYCGAPRHAPDRFAPLCSMRCRQLDLSRWLDGSYAVDEQGRLAIVEND